MNTRYTFLLPSGKRIKIRSGELYRFDGHGGFSVEFQEQVATEYGRVHTHVWFQNDANPQLTEDLYEFVTWVYEWYPEKTKLMAIIIGRYVNEEDTTVLQGPDIIYELVVERKLSKTLTNYVLAWLYLVVEELLVWRGMVGLFGGEEDE